MKKINIAIIGATGAVGKEMLRALWERNFPVSHLSLLAGKSAGSHIPFDHEDITVQRAEDFDFTGTDIVLGAANNDTALHLAPKITKAGAVFIDNSSAFRLDEAVPLIVPEINPAAALEHRGIIANPNCSTIIALTAINPIVQKYGLESIVASTYQAVSGAGEKGLAQLEAELAGKSIDSPVFQCEIARNVIPSIGGMAEDGYTSEEMKMKHEGAKILSIPDLKVSCTCVRVPVARCHCISLNIRTAEPVSVSQAQAAIAAGRGTALMDDRDYYPMPLNTENQDTVYVGRIRKDETTDNGLCLWCCGDQLRKGAAVNAVQIAELLAGITPY